jgi:hypothetical protein
MESQGMEQGMQPQAQPQPQVQQPAKAEGNGIMDLNVRTIVYAVIGGGIIGFSFGLGFLVAQRLLSKSILDKKDEPKASLSNFDGEVAKPKIQMMKKPMRKSGMNLNGGRLF